MKRFVVILCLSAMGFVACEKVSELLRFNIPVEFEFDIPPNSAFPLPPILTPSIQSNANQSFEDNNTKRDLVKEILLGECILRVNDPSNDDFDFIEDIEIYINADGQDEILIASIYDIPNDNLIEISLDPSNNQLDAYVKQDEFDIKVIMTSDQTVTQTTEVTCNMKFSVKADAL